MKKTLLAVCGLILGINGLALAQANTPVIDERQANQEQRIDQGISEWAAEGARSKPAE
jgi:hypothetical protein